MDLFGMQCKYTKRYFRCLKKISVGSRGLHRFASLRGKGEMKNLPNTHNNPWPSLLPPDHHQGGCCLFPHFPPCCSPPHLPSYRASTPLSARKWLYCDYLHCEHFIDLFGILTFWTRICGEQELAGL